MVKRPDIVIIEGLNVLQPARVPRGRPRRPDAERLLRLLRLRRRRHRPHPATGTSSASCGCARPRSATPTPTSPSTPRSPSDEAVAEAQRIWDTINGPNLVAEHPADPRPAPPWCCARTATTRSATCGCGSSEASRRGQSAELAAYDVGEPVGDRLRLRPRWAPRPSPAPAARCRTGAAGPGRCRRARPPPRRPPRRATASSSARALSTSGTLTSTCGSRVIDRRQRRQRLCRSRPSAASTCSAVRMPSPVVACSLMITWPDCSPPSE